MQKTATAGRHDPLDGPCGRVTGVFRHSPLQNVFDPLKFTWVDLLADSVKIIER